MSDHRESKRVVVDESILASLLGDGPAEAGEDSQVRESPPSAEIAAPSHPDPQPPEVASSSPVIPNLDLTEANPPPATILPRSSGLVALRAQEDAREAVKALKANPQAPADAPSPARRTPAPASRQPVRVRPRVSLPPPGVRKMAPALAGRPKHDDPESLHELGARHFAAGEFAEAARCYEKALEGNKGSWSAVLNLGLCRERLGLLDEAVDSFGRAVELSSEQPEAHAGVARCRLSQGSFEEAIEAFDRVLDARPDDSQALFGKAAGAQQLGRFKEARECYEALLGRHPGDREITWNLAGVALAMGDEKKARECAETLGNADEGRASSLMILSECAAEAGDDELAAQRGAQLVELAPGSFEAWFNLGVACQRTGRLDVAVDAYNQALAVDGSRGEAIANQGAAMHEAESYQEACELYAAALERAPDHPGLHWNMALATESLGTFDEAEKHYERVTQLQPGWKEAAARLSRLRPAS